MSNKDQERKKNRKRDRHREEEVRAIQSIKDRGIGAGSNP